MNYWRYGAFVITEVTASPFKSAYGALARISPDHWQRYIVFPTDARQRAYSVSPAAQELAPGLEGPIGQGWATAACAQYHIEPCSGVHAGWFQWALRDAVAMAGHYTSAREAAAFYDRLSSEINAACDQGRLTCGPPRSTLAPPFRWQYIGDTWREMGPMLALLLRMGRDRIVQQPSEGTPFEVQTVAGIVGAVNPPGAPRLRLQGWVASSRSAPSLRIESRSPLRFDTEIVVLPPDARSTVPDMTSLRFDLDTDCPRAQCALVVSVADAPDTPISLDAVHPGAMTLPDPGLRVFFDVVTDQQGSRAIAAYRHVQARLGQFIAAGYSVAVRVLLLPSILAFVFSLALSRRCRMPAALFALAAASGVAVVCRIILLSYLEVTSIPAESVLYLSPASPMLLVFIVVSLSLGGGSLIHLLRRRTRQGWSA